MDCGKGKAQTGVGDGWSDSVGSRAYPLWVKAGGPIRIGSLSSTPQEI
jgi:hypothetical protein